jgi:hypothetical protein
MIKLFRTDDIVGNKDIPNPGKPAVIPAPNVMKPSAATVKQGKPATANKPQKN